MVSSSSSLYCAWRVEEVEREVPQREKETKGRRRRKASHGARLGEQVEQVCQEQDKNTRGNVVKPLSSALNLCSVLQGSFLQASNYIQLVWGAPGSNEDVMPKTLAWLFRDLRKIFWTLSCWYLCYFVVTTHTNQEKQTKAVQQCLSAANAPLFSFPEFAPHCPKAFYPLLLLPDKGPWRNR